MNLYSRKKFLASAALVLACAGLFTSAVAQRRKTHKLRATAIVETITDASGKVTTRIIPVTVLDEGQFQDASIYKARPRPMAIDDGIVYEAQTSGIPVATATISNGSSSDGWIAMGSWKIITAPVKKPDASVTVSEPNNNDGRPVLHRAAGSASDSSAPSPSATPAPGSSSTSSSGTGSSNDDRPVLHRPSDSGSPAASSTPTPSSTPSPTPSGNSSSTSTTSSAQDDRPTLHRPNDSITAAAPAPTPSASQSTPQSSSAPEDPDRPTLRKHDSAPQERTQPTQVENAPGTTAAPAPVAKKPSGPPGITKTYVAVSDTQSLDVRSYDFKWKMDEVAPMELKMRKLALAQVPKQLGPQQTKAEVQLRNVAIRSFDLDLSNDAVIVLSAEIPATVPSTKERSARFISRYITLVARVDFEGEPQKILASVTDSSRQDVSPRLELIDAVDVDGDGVAELLFREYGYDDTSFVIYSIGRSTATKLFEGASRPLH
ncbi:MAG TPA: hypothetical protein VHA06_17245 [Candidatus Angelobacter sp.]|nr:hypothetical protein [Candidatus Angelobacter sp.]